MLCVMLILALRPNRQRQIRAESAVCVWLDRCARPFESLCSMSLASSTDTSSALALTYVPPPMKCPMGMQWIIGWQVAKRQPTTETESWHEQIPFCAVLRRFFPSHTWRTIFASRFRDIITTVAPCIYAVLVILAVEVILILRFISMDYITLSHFLLNLTLILWRFKTQRQSCLGKGCPVPETETKQTFHRF